jgi:hypothetical protein
MEKTEEKKGVIGISDYVRAGYSHYWLQTDESGRAIEQLKAELEGRQVTVWDCATKDAGGDPGEALDRLQLEASAGSVLVIRNMSWFLKDSSGNVNYSLVQFIQNTAVEFRSKDKRKLIVAVGAEGPDALPKEITREFVYLTLPLPGATEIMGKVEKMLQALSKDPKWVAPKDVTRVVEACKGMTLAEIDNSLAYSAVKAKTFDPLLIKVQRAAFLEKVAGVKYVEYGEDFSQLQGYKVVKDFVKFMAPPTHPEAKGILLLGPPGTGKSMFAKCLAREFNMFMLTAEMAEMTGSLVGETEAKVRSFIEAAKAMAPCVVFIDEIEKGLAGLKGFGGYSGDSLNKKAMSQFLKFLQDRPKGVYIVATCNNIADLPPEYVRAERWDTAPFFIDLPSREERATILRYYQTEYKVDGKLTAKDTDGWSGAEIKAACRLAYLGGTTTEASAKYIVPVSKTMSEDIDTLRKWAKGRTLPASEAAVESVGEGRDIELGELVKGINFKK